MKFPRLLQNLFQTSSDSHQASSDVSSEERLTRYLFSKSGFKKNANNSMEAKAAAFLPHDGETSVFRTSGLSEDMIWSIGAEFVERPRQQANPASMKARADFCADIVADVNRTFGQGLKIEPDTNVHPLHANITSWPREESLRDLIAVEIARASAVCSKP